MKFAAKSVIILGLVAFTTQVPFSPLAQVAIAWVFASVSVFLAFACGDIPKKKGCDCRICKGGDNRIANSLVGEKLSGENGGGKPGCSLCERKKELLRMERQKQEQLQKCPFEILGSPEIKGKTSEEIFDQFRELIVPSQNGFFDMMRGIVKTMHVSSEAELKWAKEKEARELAKKRAEEVRKRVEAARRRKTEQKKSGSPEEPKVTVVLKQTPCQQFLATGAQDSLYKRLPKRTHGEERRPIPDMQLVDVPDKESRSHSGLNSGNEDLAQPELRATPQAPQEDFGGLGVEVTSPTESPLVKFLTNEEFMVQSGRGDMSGGLGLDLLAGSKAWGAEPEENFLPSPPQELDQQLKL